MGTVKNGVHVIYMAIALVQSINILYIRVICWKEVGDSGCKPG